MKGPGQEKGGGMAEEKGKLELSEEERKGIYKEVWRIQNSLSSDDPDYDDKVQKAYGAVAIRYELSEDVIRQVCVEEAKKNWPPE